MSTDDVVTEDELEAEAEAAAEAAALAQPEEHRMELSVEIENAGPCQKHVRVTVPQSELSHFREAAIGEFANEAEVPGFRKGHVPAKLVERRFKNELNDQVKQRVLVQSLEQIAEDHELDPINEPDIAVESLELPEDADFVYEFDVEVRPDFELPDYEGLEIERPVRDVTDEAVESYQTDFLAQYGELQTREEPAEAGDHVVIAIEFTHEDKPLNRVSDVSVPIKPTLRFRDAELAGFDELMTGVEPGDTKVAELTVSQESERIEMRGETVQAVIAVLDVKRLEMPQLTRDFLDRIGVESEEELTEQVRSILERQVEYTQRQSTRQQVLGKITESADWDLPEQLVLRQTENALRREILEMQQAGFTTQQIQARENELRQRAVSSTRQALKEHFVLDKIATEEDIDVTPGDIETEISMMAMQRGESPRRVRARLQKSGMIENLDAQIRERKAVDFVLSKAQFKDVPAETPTEDDVAAVSHAVCGMMGGGVEDETDDDAAE